MPWKHGTLLWRLCGQMAWSCERWGNSEQIRTSNLLHLASWKQQAGWILVDVQHWAGISDSDCWISIMFSLCQSSVESQEVVLAAVQHTGMALCYASHTLQDDIEAHQT
jgi:hypothetical protein